MTYRNNEVEEEELYSGTSEKEITEPFNPKDVDIISQTMVISKYNRSIKMRGYFIGTRFPASS